MQAVYSNAACTIAATASQSSDQGLFFERDPWLVRPRCLTATWTPESDPEDKLLAVYPSPGKFWCDRNSLWMNCIEYAPLNKRGWVFQERHLSRRIMHFAGNQLFWECYECKASENYPAGLPSWAYSLFRGTDPTPLKSRVHGLRNDLMKSSSDQGTQLQSPLDSKDIDTLYSDWVEWRQEYSRSSVTKDEDKLIAIQGIAQDVGQILDDELVVGMWKKRILREICFLSLMDGGTITQPHRRQLPAPSWSWASSNQRITSGEATRTNRQGHFLAKVCHLDAIHATAGSQWATLHLQCNLIRIVPNWDILFREDPSQAEAFKKEYGDRPASSLRGFTLPKTNVYVKCDEEDIGLDDFLVSLEDRSADMYMIIIRLCPSIEREDGNVSDDMAEVLLLERRPIPEQAFQRIGFFEVEGEECRQLLHEHNVSENQTVTLV